MKARPRRVENRVAEEMTKWSAKRGDHWVFERRPAMGRTGPDIEFPNPYKFVIDVKSRKSISDKPFHITNKDRDIKWYVSNGDQGGWYICRLDHMEAMFMTDWESAKWHSKTVDEWLAHMHVWAVNHGGIAMLVLHKPWKPVGSGVIVINSHDWLRVMEGMRLI